MSATERQSVETALTELTATVIDGSLRQMERAADPSGTDPQGQHSSMAYLNAVAEAVERWRKIVTVHRGSAGRNGQPLAGLHL